MVESCAHAADMADMPEEEKPAPPPGPDGEMRSELQELQLQMNTATDEVSAAFSLKDYI